MANGSQTWRLIAVTVLVVVTLTTTLTAAETVQIFEQPKIRRPNLLCKVFASSVSISRKAGKIIRDIYEQNHHLDTVKRVGKKFRIEAEKSASKCMIASFNKLYPGVKIILADEPNQHFRNFNVSSDWIVSDLDKSILDLNCPPRYDHVEPQDIMIWLDPLDGKKELKKGFLDHVTILIGISVRETAVAGVIHQIFWEDKGRSIWGLIGRGIGGFTLHEMQPISDFNETVYITSRNKYDKTIDTVLKRLNTFRVIRKGGVGNKVLHLLERKANVYIFPGIGSRRWDTAAPEAILRASGGDLTDIRGERYSYAEHDANYPTNSINLYGVFASAPGYDRTNVSKIIDSIRPELLKMYWV